MKAVMRVTANDPRREEGPRRRDAASRGVTFAAAGVTVEARHALSDAAKTPEKKKPAPNPGPAFDR